MAILFIFLVIYIGSLLIAMDKEKTKKCRFGELIQCA